MVFFWKGRAAMEHMATTHPENDIQERALKMAEKITPITTIIDFDGYHYGIRRFAWLGNWGACNANCTKVIVPAKTGYLYVDILIHAKVIIAGNADDGWDVYSPKGELTKHLPPMTLRQAIRALR